MENNRDSAQNQNISEVLEMLKQSYSDDSSSNNEIDVSDTPEAMSADDLKEMLRMQYISNKKDLYESADGEAYNIDEKFLESAQVEQEEPEEELDEFEEVETEEELDEFEEVETGEFDESAYLDELDESDDEPLTAEEIEMLKRFSEEENDTGERSVFSVNEDDGDMTFDELPNDADDEGIVLHSIPLDDAEKLDDGIGLDRITGNYGDAQTVYTPIDIDNSDIGEPIVSENSADEPEELPWYEDEVDDSFSDDLVNNETERLTIAEQDDAELETVGEEAADVASVGSEPEQTDARDDIEAVLEEMITDTGAERPKYQVSSAELSLLMQLGCDEEIFEIASGEDIENIAIAQTLETIPEQESFETQEFGAFDGAERNIKEKTPKEELEAKLVSVYEGYHKTRGGALLRLIISSVICVVLLIYDGLPLLGVHLPGIMDRKEFFLSYVLIGLQLLVLCLAPSFKQLYVGLKRLFSKRPDVYSMICLLTIATVVYDIVIVAVEIGTPHVFHFLLAFMMTAVTAGECVSLTMQINTYRYFFDEIIDAAENGDGTEIAREKRFTLKRSSGKSSTAEKMYSGGLDSTLAVYYPLEVDSVAGYFNAINKKSRKSEATLSMLLPSLIVSLLAGILVLLLPNVEGSLWLCFGVTLTSLFLTLPIITVISVWLPFGLFNRQNIREGFAFASEQSAEVYSDCSVFAFKDMHVFEKCSPKNVNLAVYDATGKDVLIGCLDALYSKIGGPLQDIFSMGEGGSDIGECRLRRIAKSGVEAQVGNNYAVLLGNEQFMSRYGISFPEVNFKNKGDKVFSVCVSINGRASARIIAKYSVNEMFEMLAYRLREDGIYCALETFDPMISSELLARLRDSSRPPVSVVHLGIDDHESTRRTHGDGVMFDVDGGATGVIAKKSRLNLVVAASNAKRMRTLRKRTNLLCYTLCGAGLAICCLNLIFNWAESMNEFYILIYWLLSAGSMLGVIFVSLPNHQRFSMESYRYEMSVKHDRSQKKKQRNNKQ